MLFAKNNILRKWLGKSKSDFQKFYGNKTNRTAVQIYNLNDTDETEEIVAPFGTWKIDIRIKYDREPVGNGSVTLKVNGQPILLNFNVQGFDILNSMDKVISFDGTPYVERSDIFQVKNESTTDKMQVYFLFHRIMLADT